MSHATNHEVIQLPTDATSLPEPQRKKVTGIAGALAVAGLLLCAAAAFSDTKRFAFSYLTGFAWVLTIGLGGLFFVVLQHLTKAGWSVAVRRQAEWITAVLPVCILLFIPVALLSHDIYHHWMGPEAATDPLLMKKQAWLNPTFFYVRAAIYLVAWAAMAVWFRRTSLAQDRSGDPHLTVRMQHVSAPAMLVFGLTVSFASFDWLMSLDPHWYSTIFGVYVFAGAVIGALSTLALLTIVLQGTGLLRRVLTVEHQHDVGKLLFGFVVFWSYIAFSQFLLIWYANIPEETIFYRHRWEGNWKVLSMVLVIGHFALPFLYFLPRTVKRNRKALAVGAVLMLAMHYVDLYWLIMPTYDPHGFHFSWIDLAGLLGPLGVLALVLAVNAARAPLYPLKDPRLPEAVKLVNL